MSMSEQSGTQQVARPVAWRLLPAAVAVLLTVLAGVATAAAMADTTIRYLGFAAMVAAVVSGVAAVRRGPAWVRAVSAIITVLALMLGSTFFGLTYS